MSATKQAPVDILSSLKSLIDVSKKIPEEFWQRTEHQKYRVVWLLNRQKPSIERNYDYDEERFGITSDGKVIWGFDSGCSCPMPWVDSNENDAIYDVKEWKQFKLEFDEASKLFDKDWDSASMILLNDFLLLTKDTPEAEDVFKVTNMEIRRYLIRLIGFDQLSNKLPIKVLEKDGTSVLFDVEFQGQTPLRFVKVKDASTDREYILAVPGQGTWNASKTCKEAVAWTFGVDKGVIENLAVQT